MKMILASQSPRRKELLGYISKEFEIRVSDIDETLPYDMSPKDAVEYLSRIKAEPFNGCDDIIIGADTVVSIDGKILGKPENKDNAKQMLSTLSGREHSVFTGVTIIANGNIMTFSVETKVKFFPLSDEDIEWYVSTGEPMDKAGAYGIQGLGSLLVESINGDYFNVVGLPISKVNQVLKSLSK